MLGRAEAATVAAMVEVIVVSQEIFQLLGLILQTRLLLLGDFIVTDQVVETLW